MKVGLYWIFILGFFVYCSCGLIVDKSEEMEIYSSKYALLEQFAFYEGGEINISVSIDASFTLWLCRDSKTLHRSQSIFCRNTEVTGCVPLKTDGTPWYQETEEDTYLLFASNCGYDGETVEIELSYVFMNPNGQHVPAHEELVFWYYLFLTGIWWLLVLVWAFVLICGAAFVTPVHGILTTTITVRGIYSAFLLYYWYLYYWNGQREGVFKLISQFVFIISEGLFIFLLYILSCGWRIIRGGIPSVQVKKVILGLISVVLLLSIFSIFTSMSMYYLLTILILYFYILPKIITNFSTLLYLVSSQEGALSNISPNHNSLPLLRAKVKIFNRIRLVTMLFIVVVLLVNIYRFAIGSAVDHPSEGVLLVLFIIFAVTLRPKQHSFITKMSDLLRLRQTEDFIISRQDALQDEEPAIQWDISKTRYIKYPGSTKSIAIESNYAKENNVL
eukprot:TRINITY_DN3390_c0_g1_i1.p1 TRINITY_DN3390_c0_g1~~TRINITY_DN3390_c0_g1_i1.p1  ORF type:complete len:446 (-),score=61.46 TRINITY_DN3390_c0_g1_i1:16-1353(-)